MENASMRPQFLLWSSAADEGSWLQAYQAAPGHAIPS